MVSYVIKRDGSIVPFDANRIRNAIRKAMLAVGRYDEGILKKVTEYVVKVLDEKFKEKYPHVEEIQDIVELALIKFDLYEVAKAYISYRKEKEKQREEKRMLLGKWYEEEVAKKFSVNAIRLLVNRYLLKDENGNLIEGPKQLFQRVAMLIVIPDILYDKRIFDKEGKQEIHPEEESNPEEWEGKLGFRGNSKEGFEVTWNRYHLERMKYLYDELNSQGKMKVPWSKFLEMLKNGEFERYYENYRKYFDMMVNKKFMPNSPTLFNAGAPLGQLSACFVLDIDDSIESIMETAKEVALIFKSGGGVGINYSKIRPKGDIVRSTSGLASGPVSFMRIIDVLTDVIKQGGCVAADSYLFTDKGIIRGNWIDPPNPRDDFPLPVSIYDGKDYVDAFLGSFGSKQEILKFITENGYELEVTYNELLATVNGAGEIVFKPAHAIKESDYLVLVLGNHVGKRVSLPRVKISHHNSNKVTVPKYLNKDLAEILGYYMADGSWNNGRLILSFNDKRIFEYFREKIRDVFGLEVGEVRDRGTWIDAVWFSKDLERYFKERGWYKNNSSEAFIPADVLQSEEGVLAAFLRGLFEGDGSVHRDGYPVLYTTSESLLKDVQIALLSLRILSSITVVEKEKLGKEHFGNKDVYQLRIVDKESVKRFLELIGFISENKNKKVQKIFKKKYEMVRIIPNVSQKLIKVYERIREKDHRKASRFYRLVHKYMLGYRNFTYNTLLRLRKEFEELNEEFDEKYDKYVFLRVKKIEKTKKEVFHLETSSGKYVVNGFLVHNKRRGANMGILEIWHPDILDFIHAKEKEGILENFNISVMITPDFWEYYEKDEEYPLRNPRDGKVWRRIRARDLIDEIAMAAWRTADPGVLFMDNINRRNVMKEYLGSIRATNPCGEEPLYPYESCNLGSINLYSFVKRDENGNAYFDWEEFRETVKWAYRFLDNVVDVNKFPLKKIEERTKKLRKVGLGFMGLADTLFALKIPYNSEEGFKMIMKISENLTYFAMKESVERAKERGTFPFFEKSLYTKGEMPVEGFYHKELWTLDWEALRNKIMKYGIRNLEVTSIAPTGSISMICDVSSGIEPQFALVFEKRVTAGTFYYTDVEFRRQLEELGMYNSEILRKVSENGGSVQGIEEIPEEIRRVFVTALDIPWWDHVRAQAVAQFWITTSISKTINMPEWVTPEDVKNAYLFAHKAGCKGITIYREGSKSVQVIYLPAEVSKNRYRETIKLVKNRTLEIMEEMGIKVDLSKYFRDNGEELILNVEVKPKKEFQEKESKKIERCPVCGSTRLVYQGGCVTCLDCGWSACAIA